MAVTVDQVVAYVGATLRHSEECQRCLAEAEDLLGKHITDGGTEIEEIPAAVYDRAVLVTAAELFNQSKSPNGFVNQQFEDGSGAIVRLSRDPLGPAYPLLSRWVAPLGFA